MTKPFNNDIWVYIDQRNRKHLDLCLHLLAAARNLAEPLKSKATAILLGLSPEYPNINDTAEACLAQGADHVLIVDQSELNTQRTDIHAQALFQIIQQKVPRAVLFALSDFSREIAARTACMCHAGLIADCVTLQVEGGQIKAGCPSWGGEIMAELGFSDPTQTGFATVQPHAFQKSEVRGTPGTVEKISVQDMPVSQKLKCLSSSEAAVDHQKLEEAEIVVVGGAGLGNADGFALVRQLAAAMGGEVGATRPPVVYHWVDEERLIGQTGKTVRPGLLISVGTSGAIQYTVGITESKTIVAVDRNPNTPIFHIADFGIVADAKSFLPPLIARVKQVVMRDLADALSGEKTNGAGSGFGQKLKKLRESHGWTIEELAQHTGQSPESIQQVEKDEVVPSVSFLLRLSKALKIDPGTFLHDEEKAAIRDQRAQAFIKRTKNYYYQTLTPGAENEHLRGFMITIEPNQVHKPVAYKHEGEEFIYVMEGDLELTLDNKKNHLRPGESKHFNSETPHKLKNLGNQTTRCLVVLYTP
ncbi:MAG: FAD-binding protein [Deltaproteobacteria bacterium]|nr:FAD-binding protein [Deltaproteobacteria bacterium]